MYHMISNHKKINEYITNYNYNIDLMLGEVLKKLLYLITVSRTDV